MGEVVLCGIYSVCELILRDGSVGLRWVADESMGFGFAGDQVCS